MSEFTGYPKIDVEQGGTFVFHLQNMAESAPVGFVAHHHFPFSVITSAQGYQEDKFYAIVSGDLNRIISLDEYRVAKDYDETHPGWKYYTPPINVDNSIIRRLEIRCEGSLTITVYYDERGFETHTFDPDEQTQKRSLEGYRAKRVRLKIEGDWEAKLKWLNLIIIPRVSFHSGVYGEE